MPESRTTPAGSSKKNFPRQHRFAPASPRAGGGIVREGSLAARRRPFAGTAAFSATQAGAAAGGLRVAATLAVGADGHEQAGMCGIDVFRLVEQGVRVLHFLVTRDLVLAHSRSANRQRLGGSGSSAKSQSVTSPMAPVGHACAQRPHQVQSVRSSVHTNSPSSSSTKMRMARVSQATAQAAHAMQRPKS